MTDKEHLEQMRKEMRAMENELVRVIAQRDFERARSDEMQRKMIIANNPNKVMGLFRKIDDLISERNDLERFLINAQHTIEVLANNKNP